MRFSSLSVFCALTCVYAAPHRRRDGYAIQDSHPVPSTWTRLHRAPGDHMINLRIGLKQAGFPELERHLSEVSDPKHERYGQHLSNDEVQRLVAPDGDALDAVYNWLSENHVDLSRVQYSLAKDWIVVPMPVSDIESLLDTEYHVYENKEGSTIIRTPQYRLPIALHDHIDLVQPTTYFADPKALERSMILSTTQPQIHQELPAAEHPAHNSSTGDLSNINAVCNEFFVTNTCLRTLYKTIDYIPQVPEQNSVAMTAFLNDTANITDFKMFMSVQRGDASSDYVYNYTTFRGGPNDQSPVDPDEFGSRDVEANLDSQMIGGFVYPTQFTVYSTGSEPPFKPDLFTPTDSNEPYLAWLNEVLRLENPPHTISTSYGDDEQTVPYKYAKRVCEEMAQLGAKGVTLLFAAGDSGVGANGTCVSNDGKNTTMFIPEFPASCPYVTSVGGTRNFNPEIVAFDENSGFVSGSGVSNYFARPQYQESVVSSYLSSIGNLHSGLYNTSGRAYPDIAAQGFQYQIYYGGRVISVDGSSVAAPCATSVLTLLNDALIAAGKSPLGFLNPALYSSLCEGFTDVLSGSTSGCGTSGFPAQKGWDLASGFGSPDFLKLKDLVVGPIPEKADSNQQASSILSLHNV